jgi:hypothetical protein
VLIVLALRGVLEVIRRREFILLAIVLGWSANLAAYFLTFFREGYFLLSYASVLLFVAVGVEALVTDWHGRPHRIAWSVLFLLFASLGLLIGDLTMIWVPMVLLCGICGLWVGLKSHLSSIGIQPRRAVMILCIMLLTASLSPVHRSLISQPKARRLGVSGDEQAAIYMRETFEPFSRIGTYSLAPVTLAKMQFVAMHEETRQFTSIGEFDAWILDEDLQAIYIDQAFRSYEPTLWALVKELLGWRLEVGFQDEPGEHVVLVVADHETRTPDT